MEVASGSALGCLVHRYVAGEPELASGVRSPTTVALRRDFQQSQKRQWGVSRFPSCEFMDQSHFQFYGEPSKERNYLLKKNGLSQLRRDVKNHQMFATCGVTFTETEKDATTLAQESFLIIQQDLLKDIADLKARVKEKKQELKAQKKALKKALKAKNSKPAKVKASSSSSSSSESSACNCETVEMEALRDSRKQAEDAEAVPSAVQQEEIFVTFLGQPTSGTAENFDRGLLLTSRCGRKVDSTAPGSLASRTGKVGAEIEVCVGGKCKRAGAEQLLASLQASIPSNASVQAAACKCMGKCGMSINVRVAKHDTNPQQHCHVASGDAETLLRHHFGFGRVSPSNTLDFEKLALEFHRLNSQKRAPMMV